MRLKSTVGNAHSFQQVVSGCSGGSDRTQSRPPPYPLHHTASHGPAPKNRRACTLIQALPLYPHHFWFFLIFFGVMSFLEHLVRETTCGLPEWGLKAVFGPFLRMGDRLMIAGYGRISGCFRVQMICLRHGSVKNSICCAGGVKWV